MNRIISVSIIAVIFSFVMIGSLIANYDMALYSIILMIIAGVSIFMLELSDMYKSSYSNKRRDKIQPSTYFLCLDCNMRFEGKVNDASHYGHKFQKVDEK